MIGIRSSGHYSARVPQYGASAEIPSGTPHGTMGSKLLASMVVAGWLVAGTAAAQSSPSQSGLSLDQAVVQVQQRVGGKVLSAEPRHIGRRVEYRIKVLTPEGHVRVMAVSSDASKNPASSQSTKNPPVKNAGSKEKH